MRKSICSHTSRYEHQPCFSHFFGITFYTVTLNKRFELLWVSAPLSKRLNNI